MADLQYPGNIELDDGTSGSQADRGDDSTRTIPDPGVGDLYPKIGSGKINGAVDLPTEEILGVLERINPKALTGELGRIRNRRLRDLRSWAEAIMPTYFPGANVFNTRVAEVGINQLAEGLPHSRVGVYLASRQLVEPVYFITHPKIEGAEPDKRMVIDKFNQHTEVEWNLWEELLLDPRDPKFPYHVNPFLIQGMVLEAEREDREIFFLTYETERNSKEFGGRELEILRGLEGILGIGDVTNEDIIAAKRYYKDQYTEDE